MNWKKVKLGDTATFVNGYAFKPTEWSETGLPIIRIQNLTGNAYESNYFNGKVPAKYLVKNGDILVSWSASLGVYEWPGNDAWLNQHIFKVVFDKMEVDKSFFKYLLLEKVEEMKGAVHGATMQHITKSRFDSLEVKLPDLATQKHIAAVLDKADALRQQNRQLLAHYDELLQSTFIELFGKMNPEYSKWNTFKIEEIAESKKGSMRSGPFGSDLLHSEFVDSGIFVLGIDNVVSNKFEWAKMRYITPEKYEKLKRYTVYSGDLLISIMATVGRVAIVPENMPLSINSKHLAAITLDKSKVEPIFVAYNLHSNPEVTKQITARGRGAIMEGLNLGLIKGIEIKVPPLPLQQHFAKIVEQIEAQKEVARQSLAESEALFEGLLAGYFGAS